MFYIVSSITFFQSINIKTSSSLPNIKNPRYMNIEGESMENKDVHMKCYKCGGRFTSAEMRYDPMRPGQLACKQCLERGSKPKAAERSNKIEESETGVVKYYCIKCNYKFTRKKGAKVTTCPYCNREGSLTCKTDVNSLLATSGAEFED